MRIRKVRGIGGSIANSETSARSTVIEPPYPPKSIGWCDSSTQEHNTLTRAATFAGAT